MKPRITCNLAAVLAIAAMPLSSLQAATPFGSADWKPASPDSSRGFTHMPFAWEDVGELDLPVDRSTIEINPTWIPYGNIFCDVLGVELVPVQGDADKR